MSTWTVTVFIDGMPNHEAETVEINVSSTVSLLSASKAAYALIKQLGLHPNDCFSDDLVDCMSVDDM